MTSLGTDGGAPKSSYWLLASMLPSVLYKEEVQHRGVRIHAGAYTRDPFSRADSRPLVAPSSELVLHSDLDKSYPKPVCQHYLIGTSS